MEIFLSFLLNIYPPWILTKEYNLPRATVISSNGACEVIPSAQWSKSSNNNSSFDHLKRLLWSPWWLRRWRICLHCRRPRFNPWVRKIPWRRGWLPTPIVLPGEVHGQRSLVGYSPWGRKESDMTSQLTHIHPAHCGLNVLVSLDFSLHIYENTWRYVHLSFRDS